MTVPAIPYLIVSTLKLNNALRQENRNANSLAEAWAIFEKETRKPFVRHCELLVRLHAVDRRGGITPDNGA